MVAIGSSPGRRTAIVLDLCHDLAVHYETRSGSSCSSTPPRAARVATDARYANQFVFMLTAVDRKIGTGATTSTR